MSKVLNQPSQHLDTLVNQPHDCYEQLVCKKIQLEI
jgi:hypothetical protein